MSSAKEYISSAGSFKTSISPAVRKALIKFWGTEDIVDQPEILVELGPDGVSRINRIGRKSLHEIARALDSCGYLDSSDSWLFKGEY